MGSFYDETNRAANVSEWLREVRLRRGMSQEAVAHAAELAVSTYGRLERGQKNDSPANPTLATFVRVCVALDITRDEFVALTVGP